METRKRVSKRLILCILLSLITLQAHGNASAQGQPVLVSPLPVFAEGDEGFYYSAVRGILEEADLTPEFLTLSFSERLIHAQQKNNTLTAGIVRTPEREDQYYWITPLTANYVSFFTTTSALVENKVLSPRANVGIVKGDFREHIAMENTTEAQRVFYPDWAAVVEGILAKEVDGTFFNAAGLKLICEQATLDCSSIVSTEQYGLFYGYLALPRTPENAALAERLSLAAPEYKSKAEFSQLAQRTVSVLQEHGLNASVSYGVLSFSGELNADTSDLWVIADIVPFFSYLGEHGTVNGIAADLVRAVLTQAGMSSRMLTAPRERIVKEAQSKSNVVAYAIALTPEREPIFDWITPISRNLHGLYGVGKERYSSFDELPKTLRIGTRYQDYRTTVAENAGFQVTTYTSWHTLMQALLNGDIDAAFASQGAVGFGCESLRDSCESVELVAPYKITTTYLVLSKSGTSPIVAEQLKLAAVAVKSSEEFRQTSHAWSEMMMNEHNVIHHFDNGVVHLWKKQ
ncbi:transporter substrate-binding domain-containing protein [Alteromonas sp. KUL49]|uniref:substrate-binding periplasmic protein n=1 Tax=Alteromonas sp. KUL49 TaxID=2480798 RepID=UPI0013EEA590|nr:transporter substrate-binding domain-containing protein [Alteromonas sp. KUL49]